jgi:hypothetical protein
MSSAALASGADLSSPVRMYSVPMLALLFGAVFSSVHCNRGSCALSGLPAAPAPA